MKYQDKFETKVEVIAHDKWVNIDMEGKFSQEGSNEELHGYTCIDIPKGKALEMAKEIIAHFGDN